MQNTLGTIFIFGTYNLLRLICLLGAVALALHASALLLEQAGPGRIFAICLGGAVASGLWFALGHVRDELLEL